MEIYATLASIQFSANGIEETKVEAHGTKKLGKIATNKFYHELAQKLINAKELVVMGPGIAKEQFKHHCESHTSTTYERVDA